MKTEWLKMSASGIGAAIDRREIDPVELTETFLTAAESHPLANRIYARLTPDRALAEAKSAAERARLGLRRSPLDGVPVSWKDLFDTAGAATESGSRLLQNRTPKRDAAVLTNASHSGLICLGKTHMSELAFSGLGYNPVTATPPCVNDDKAVSGGSSSGAAASVAFDLAPAAIGSDTGGSVRIPAAWNDLVGLKTTHGLLSLEGVVPLCPRFDSVGPIGRSVADANHLLAVLSGGKPADLSGAQLRGRHFLMPTTMVLDTLSPEVEAGFQAAVSRIEDAGATVSQRELPIIAQAQELSPILFSTEAYAVWREVIEASPDVMFPEILARFRSGARHLAVDYVAAWRRLDELRAAWAQQTAGFDAVLTPTAPNLPPAVDKLAADKDFYVMQNLLTLRNTRVGNLFGLCGLTIPTGVPSVGIQILGSPGHEPQIMRLGQAVEDALAEMPQCPQPAG